MASHRGLLPIDRLAVGMRALAWQGQEPAGYVSPPEMACDPSTLRLLKLRLDVRPGQRVEVQLLRSLDWIRLERAAAGAVLWLDLPHVGVRGEATVLAIEACPPLTDGPGRLITGTFKHNVGWVYELVVEGEGKPIRVTGLHPFWSADHNRWVQVKDLRIGERLLAQDGSTPSVVSLILRAESEALYNVEIEGEHCYRVGEQGLLVHNASTPCTAHGLSPGQSRILDKHTVTVWHRTGPMAPRGAQFHFMRVKKKIANLKYEGSSSSRDPDDFMRELIKYGDLAIPGTTLGVPQDDVGHIVANQFGGYANKTRGNGNVFPQNAGVNRYEFGPFETNTVKPAISDVCDVCIEIEFFFEPSSSTPHRPTSFTYKWWIGPTAQPSKTFQNPK